MIWFNIFRFLSGKNCSTICPEKATENSIQMVNVPYQTLRQTYEAWFPLIKPTRSCHAIACATCPCPTTSDHGEPCIANPVERNRALSFRSGSPFAIRSLLVTFSLREDPSFFAPGPSIRVGAGGIRPQARVALHFCPAWQKCPTPFD